MKFEEICYEIISQHIYTPRVGVPWNFFEIILPQFPTNTLRPDTPSLLLESEVISCVVIANPNDTSINTEKNTDCHLS